MRHCGCSCLLHVLLFLCEMTCLNFSSSLCYRPHGLLLLAAFVTSGADYSSCHVPDRFIVPELNAMTVQSSVSWGWTDNSLCQMPLILLACHRCCPAFVKSCVCMTLNSSCWCGATSQRKPASFPSWVSMPCTEVWPSVPGWWPQLTLLTR